MAGEISHDNMLKLSGAAKAAGVSRQTLQYYLMIGLISPSCRTPGGRQLFDNKAVSRIRLISKLNSSGYALREIREIFLKEGR